MRDFQQRSFFSLANGARLFNYLYPKFAITALLPIIRHRAEAGNFANWNPNGETANFADGISLMSLVDIFFE